MRTVCMTLVLVIELCVSNNVMAIPIADTTFLFTIRNPDFPSPNMEFGLALADLDSSASEAVYVNVGQAAIVDYAPTEIKIFCPVCDLDLDGSSGNFGFNARVTITPTNLFPDFWVEGLNYGISDNPFSLTEIRITQLEPASIQEPASLGLMLLGLIMTGFIRRGKRETC